MLGELLWCLVQFGVTSPTEECDPEVLPHVTIGGGSLFVRHPTVRAERYLLSQILAVIDSHSRQAILLMKLMDHILSVQPK